MEGKVFYNSCPAAGCHSYCVLKVWTKDGKICKVESADHPGDPGARCICLKGLSSPRLVYHADRLKYPLKRVGEKGEGKWQRISWDEALDAIADKLLKIKGKYGSESLKIIPRGSSHVGFISRLVGERFAHVWGAGGEFEGFGALADAGPHDAKLLILGDTKRGLSVRDFKHSKMMVLWGWNPAETAFPEMKAILDARDNGVKLVVVGVHYDATAAKADQFIPVRSGADAALILGMMNVIIEQGVYDEDYITKYTVGPFLVREDNKLFLRDGDRYMVWDKAANTPGTYDSTARPALLGSFTVGGIRCKPAFQLLADRASQYTPEKAAEISEVPAETIRRLALEYAAAKPAAIYMSPGMARTFMSNLGCRAVIILAAITGNIGILGGRAPTSEELGVGGPAPHPIILNEKGVTTPPGAPGWKKMPGTTTEMKGWAAIRDGKPYPIKALINQYQNMFLTYGHIDAYREITSKFDLFVVIDIFMTWTARYADIVLPAATVFERDDILFGRDYILRMEKAIEPLYEAKPGVEIWSELARRVGLGEYFKYTTRDYMRILLDSPHPSVAGITLERLEKEKVVKTRIPSAPVTVSHGKEFPTDSGRIEFYQERLLPFGEELPLHKERLESPRTSPLARNYPWSFLTAKSRMFTHTLMHNVDWLREIDPEPTLDINPSDAQKRGIKDNDMVLVFNDRGRVKLKARVSEAVPPGTVNCYHGWGPEQFAEGYYSYLTHRVDDLSIVNPSLDIKPIIGGPMTTAHLIFWDCLVQVKKA